jgi:hypothetical protein
MQARARMHNLTRRHGAWLAILAVLLLPAPAAAVEPLSLCPSRPLAQPFLPWSDPAWYVTVPDGGLEDGGTAWTLRDGASVRPGNEPYFVRSALDEWSLKLPAGSSAATAPACVDTMHPTLRFFARNAGARDSVLRVSASFFDSTGALRLLTIGAVTADSQWSPTPLVPVITSTFAGLGRHPVSFVFTPDDDRGNWWIDDVYVDPYGKG